MKCSFNIQNDKNLVKTVEWFQSVGMNWIESYEDLHYGNTVEVEFIDSPSILDFFSRLGTVDICKITQQGISFYLTSIPLGGLDNSEQVIISDKADGVVFCPMGNVKMINTFGNVKPNQANAADAKNQPG